MEFILLIVSCPEGASDMSYCEWPEFYSETFPKARKQHRCIECCAPIEIGEEHLYYKGKWEGDFSAARQHMLCRELCMSLRKSNWIEDCVPFGGLMEEWSNFFWDKKTKQSEKERRNLMAQIKWRERKYRTFRKRDIHGLWNRKYGSSWFLIEANKPAERKE